MKTSNPKPFTTSEFVYRIETRFKMTGHKFKCDGCGRTKKCRITECEGNLAKRREDANCPKMCGRCLREQRHKQNASRRMK